MVIVLPRPVGVCLRARLSSNVRRHQLLTAQLVMKTLLLALVTLSFGITASANVRYEYSGRAVGPNAVALFTPTDTVTGYFVVSGVPQTGNYFSSDFLDYGIQIAGLWLNKTSGAEASAYLQFTNTGQLISWSFVVGNYTQPKVDPSLVEVWANSPDLPPSGDRITVYYQGRNQLGAATEAGNWIVQASPIPEPAPSLLLVLGLPALIVKRYIKNDA